MDGLQGKGRKIASDEAVAIVEDHSKAKLDIIETRLIEEAENKQELKEEILKSKIKRASKVVELLNQ